MRELKFRAWDKKEKKWLLGYEYPNLGGFSLFGETVLMGEWAGTLDQYLFSKEGHAPDDLVVMQYTGLKDKNGKEIYEGDILQYFIDKDYRYLWKVEFRYGSFCRIKITDGAIRNLTTEIEAFTVIGNIYESKQLLEGK